MPLHPDARAFLDSRELNGARPIEELDVSAARAQSERLGLLVPGPAVEHVHDRVLPGPYGPIPLRIYHPAPPGRLPLIVFFHGGGWVVGSLDAAEATCRAWANDARAVVVSVNYHHAPEHPFPAAVEDAYTATRWASEHASELGGDSSRLVVAGQSAGGNLAAVAAIMARDRGGPPIALQILWAPVLDCDLDTASYLANATGYGLTRAGMQWFWNHYAPDPNLSRNPYASPLRAPELARLPPALVLTAEFDPLRDEAHAYADRLSASGVPVTYLEFAGMVHGYLGPAAAQAVADAVRSLAAR